MPHQCPTDSWTSARARVRPGSDQCFDGCEARLESATVNYKGQSRNVAYEMRCQMSTTCIDLREVPATGTEVGPVRPRL